MTERSAGSSRIFRLAHGTPDLVQVAQAARADYDRCLGWRRFHGLVGLAAHCEPERSPPTPSH